MLTNSIVAQIGSLLGDPARVNMMIALLDGRAHTAQELARAGGVSPQTASSHLAKLVDANMVIVERQGRHRYHRLASAEVANLMEQMHVAGEMLAAKRSRARCPDSALRELRSCYDHLAGRVAVELSARLFADPGRDPGAKLTANGEARLQNLGLDLKAIAGARRPFCRMCLDWSERRPHVAGSLGASIFTRFGDLGWVKRQAEGRALTLTTAGERGLGEVFGIRPREADLDDA